MRLQTPDKSGTFQIGPYRVAEAVLPLPGTCSTDIYIATTFWLRLIGWLASMQFCRGWMDDVRADRNALLYSLRRHVMRKACGRPAAMMTCFDGEFGCVR
jgi:hypothetical protein